MPNSAHHVPIVRPAMISPAVDSAQAQNRFYRLSCMRSKTAP
jgi:hypothetical protein